MDKYMTSYQQYYIDNLCMKQSPCINYCKLDDNFCVGCGRSLYEIKNWENFSDKEKIEINKRLIIS